MAGEPSPTVSVTIVLHNSEQDLPSCLASIRPDVLSGFAELIVVDNSSRDASVEVAERELPDLHVIRSRENRGFAAGANLAWPQVRGSYWLLLNPDARLEHAGLRTLSKWMDSHPRIGVASPELKDDHGGGLCSAGRALPSTSRTLLEAFRLHLLLPTTLRGRILRGAYWRGGDQTDAGWVPGTAMMARRQAVESVGLLDERFFLYGEDIEWCSRMRRAGWTIGVCSNVRAYHRQAASAFLTFGRSESQLLMARGEVEAARLLLGPRKARLYACATALALSIESLHPRRDEGQRATARTAARSWRKVVRERASGPMEMEP